MDKCLCSKEDMGVLIGTLCGDCGRKEKRLVYAPEYAAGGDDSE